MSHKQRGKNQLSSGSRTIAMQAMIGRVLDCLECGSLLPLLFRLSRRG